MIIRYLDPWGYYKSHEPLSRLGTPAAHQPMGQHVECRAVID